MSSKKRDQCCSKVKVQKPVQTFFAALKKLNGHIPQALPPVITQDYMGIVVQTYAASFMLIVHLPDRANPQEGSANFHGT